MKTLFKFIFFLAIYFIHSCNEKTDKNVSSIEKLEKTKRELNEIKVDSIKKTSSFTHYLNKFKYKGKKEFKISYESFKQDSLVSLKTKDLSNFLKENDIKKYNDSLLYEHYYYSYQPINKNFESLSLILNTEYRWDLYLLTYNFKGNQIDKFPLSSFGGDGDFSFYSYGNFINDSIYVKTYVEKEYKDDENGNEKIKIDSTTTKYLLKYNGEIEEVTR